MRRCLRVALLASLAAGGLPARAQEKPAAAPDAKEEPAAEAPKPAKPHPDEPALRDAIKSLATALQEGNRDGIRQAMYAANATERKMLDAMAEMAAQLAQLHKASAKAFGDDEAKLLTGDVGMEMGRIDEAEVSIEGDSATVRYKDPAPPATADPAAPAVATAPPADGEA